MTGEIAANHDYHTFPSNSPSTEQWRQYYGEALTPLTLYPGSRHSRHSGRVSATDTASTSSSLTASPWRSPLRTQNTKEIHCTPTLRRFVKEESTLLFRDGERAIDLVLAWTDEMTSAVPGALPGSLEAGQEIAESRRREKRSVFQRNLAAEGLHLETEHRENSFDRRTYFLKIHVPWKVMNRYAEIMNLKMPTKRFITVSSKAWTHESEEGTSPEPSGLEALQTECQDLEAHLSEVMGCRGEHQEPSFLASASGKPREEKFVVKDREVEFTSAQRSQVVWQILLRCRYDDCDKDKKLYLEWARAGTWYKRQPLWLVRKYFGDKIGLYFAWLGFYTEMLVPASIVGLLCFLYGCLSLGSADNVPSREICDMSIAGNLTLCPLCDKACDYQQLGNSCFFAQMSYFFDNPATVFFAIFMSFWATSFLELWKRQQAVIAWEWDLQHVDEEQDPRPEFEASVKTFRINPVTGRREPFLPVWSKAVRFLATGSMVLFMVCVVLCAVLGTIIYRISVVSVMYGSGGGFIRKHAKIVAFMSAAVINLFIIMILTKGRFFVHPGDADARRSEFLRLKGDVCDPAGCLSELCIQLAIIMIGKQGFNNFVELLLPKLENWYRKRTHRSQTHDKERVLTRWEEDFQLKDPGRLALFQEYLEMVLQYGFVTLFVAAFPLAPLFALINNVGEIRLDAYKMLTQARRPLAERVEDIGAWYGILQGITYTAVVFNAFVIAYTSDFIPRMVYKFGYSPNSTLEGYIRSSLSMFNTSDYQADMGADHDSPVPPVCWYRGYRNPPESPAKYDLSSQYWQVFAARLAFIVVFEHIVFALTGIMAYAIPDVPSEVRTQIQRERLLEREAKFEARRRELSRSASEGTPALSDPPPLFSARHRKSALQTSLWEVT